MSGILDSRKRIMDTIVTLEGRRQISSGDLRVEYVSFTDAATFYSKDLISGSADATLRLYFEQCHLPQDQITFEADDSGKLKPFKNSSGINVYGGAISEVVTEQLFEGSSKENTTYLTGDSFVSTAGSLLASSIENFKKLYVIGSKDYLFEDDGFDTGVPNVQFEVTDKSPLVEDVSTRLLDNLPSLFEDKHFSNVINFKFLPPINKVLSTNETSKNDPNFIENNKIGDYQRLGNYDEYAEYELENDLMLLEEKGHKKTITFDPTSMSNKLLTQIFEMNDSEIKKLDVVDYGTYKYNDKIKQAFFVGKVLVDGNGTDTFVKMFTLVFE